MNRSGLKQNWYIILVTVLFFLQLIVMTAWGEHSFVAVHDNLDLFVAHNTMLKKAGLFFVPDSLAPMLGGISRDTLGSEFYLYNLLYLFFSPYGAYVAGYLLKILIGFGGSLLLAKEVLKEDYRRFRGLVWLVGAGFAMVPVFPAYGIAFTSIPLLLVYLIRLDKKPGVLWYVLLFCYPWLSYFSYFGFFLLVYLVLAVVILWVKRKKLPASLAAALPVLACGYMVWEYRLFRQMLFGDEVTIRSTMVNADATVREVLNKATEGFFTPVFHAQDSHSYWILWICLIVITAVNVNLMKKKKGDKILKEPVNLVLLLILLNCLIYGLYDYRPLRELIENLIPPLKGFQFNRTIFFNPFLWYLLFFLCLKKILKIRKKGKNIGRAAACGIAVVGVLVCMLVPQVYNDFYHNCYHHAYEWLKGQASSRLSFKEFYSEQLFTQIKESLDYQGEWSAAYGMHPAVLQYNGIATLDGYLGIYSQTYKESFRKVIAPALDNSEEFAVLYDTWGARAYLYSGAGENTYQPLRDLKLQDNSLHMNIKAFKELGGSYIFSRIKLENSAELGLDLAGEFEGEDSPYTIYVYEASVLTR